ncbi:MAG: Adenine phosphoribosyltransferase [uncultured Gemmatimonadetes bacterium]|uniref:Adenine phosphoribosyltransferase n=1 Tax=uncultured Gemmatimonadota bacterium TaxID=203437 RepID=A0A6J4MUF6_9BACT|nr:MAG: Adenine phosphoribosyltransferase [uncultured Gemmatimonadota bacterium]
MPVDHLKTLIRDVPDFPLPGILFRDVTPLLRDPGALREVTAAFATRFRGQVDVVAGIESRGFIFGAPLAVELGVGFVPVRKAGKLPAEKVSLEYELEYGTSILEIHADAVRPGERVLLVDDLLATGGTARAAAGLIAALGGTVAAVAVVIELLFLEGRATLPGTEVHALLQY